MLLFPPQSAGAAPKSGQPAAAAQNVETALATLFSGLVTAVQPKSGASLVTAQPALAARPIQPLVAGLTDQSITGQTTAPAQDPASVENHETGAETALVPAPAAPSGAVEQSPATKPDEPPVPAARSTTAALTPPEQQPTVQVPPQAAQPATPAGVSAPTAQQGTVVPIAQTPAPLVTTQSPAGSPQPQADATQNPPTQPTTKSTQLPAPAMPNDPAHATTHTSPMRSNAAPNGTDPVALGRNLSDSPQSGVAVVATAPRDPVTRRTRAEPDLAPLPVRSAPTAATTDPATLRTVQMDTAAQRQSPPTVAATDAQTLQPQMLTTELERRSPEEMLLRVAEDSTLARETAALRPSSAPTPDARPGRFNEAVLAQVKSADINAERTRVELNPRGLGHIDIEISTDPAATARVVIRAENPMVLQALREDRAALAQAIGISDESQLQFDQRRDQSSEQRFTNSQSAPNTPGEALNDEIATPTAPAKTNVIDGKQLDITT